MIGILLTSALRTLVTATLAEGTFRVLRIHHPVFRKAVWACVLLSGFAMPLLQTHSLIIRLPILQSHAASFTMPRTVAAGFHTLSMNSPDDASGVSQSANVVSHSSLRLPTLPTVALSIYLLLVGILLLRIALGFLVGMRVLVRSVPLGFAANRSVRLSSEIETPWTFGSWILLPTHAAKWDEHQLRLVLAHENCHVRQFDFYLQLMARTYAAVFWFSPLGWWLLRECERLGEQTSDHAALFIAEDNSQYARLLLRFSTSSTLPAVCMARQSGMRERVETILNCESLDALFEHPKRAAISAFFAVALSILAGSLGLRGQTTGKAQIAAEQERKMAAEANPSFLVATIKPTDPNTTRQGWSFESEGRHITCFNATLHDIVTMAYGVHAKQIAGAPAWFDKDRFDISGIPDQPGVPNIKQEQHMYQQLLADRFHLVFHREQREMPIYAITVAKNGPKLVLADPKETPNTASRGGSGYEMLKFANISMSELALNLNFYEDRPIINETSLTGRYDFTLKWADDLSTENNPDMPPALFTAAREQAGLRIEAVKGFAEVLVIDHIEQPSKN